MSIGVNAGVGLKPNTMAWAIVKEVRYDPCEWSGIGQEQIYMETTGGKICNWFINNHCRIRVEEFNKTKSDILSGKIVPGTEVIIVCNPNGILSFGLDNDN